jgi:hypothetical protein
VTHADLAGLVGVVGPAGLVTDLDHMRGIGALFDPAGLMKPGKVLPPNA